MLAFDSDLRKSRPCWICRVARLRGPEILRAPQPYSHGGWQLLAVKVKSWRVTNFAHAITYTIGVYLLVTLVTMWKVPYLWASVLAVLVVMPIGYLIERFIICRLYGESLDYTFIATFAVSLIGVDLVKWIWGVQPKALGDPVRKYVELVGFMFRVYRILIVAIAILLFFALQLFVKRTMVGKTIVAALEDREKVRCLGIKLDKYFSFVFVLGSALAALGGVLYAPIISVHRTWAPRFCCSASPSPSSVAWPTSEARSSRRSRSARLWPSRPATGPRARRRWSSS